MSQIMQTQDTKLSNAQLLTLHATPIVVVPKPGSGLGLIPIGAYLVVDSTAGAYTLGSGSDLVIQAQGLTGVLLTVDVDGPLIASAGINTWAGYLTTASGLVVPNIPLVIANSGSGEYSGGDALNHMSVRVLFYVVPTVIFGHQA